jgi:hypothetical protein
MFKNLWQEKKDKTLIPRVNCGLEQAAFSVYMVIDSLARGRVGLFFYRKDGKIPVKY